MAFEQRMKDRVEQQIALVKESNRLLMCQAVALERIAKAIEKIAEYHGRP